MSDPIPTYQEFLELLPNNGWTLQMDGAIIRKADETYCPWLYVREVLKRAIGGSGSFLTGGHPEVNGGRVTAHDIWRAADNRSYADPEIRRDLLRATGLLPSEPVR